MAERKVTSSSRWWWFESHVGSRRSTWLRSTLSELDNKTEAMLSLIEEEADSFAKRAEMYYKKRPELIAMVEDLYRSHHSLAENYDLLRTDSGARTNLALPFSFKKCASTTDQDSIVDQSYDDYSEMEDSSEPEVYDPEIVQFMDGIEGDSMGKLREEAGRLRGENERQREELAEKDEEKREVIRQLSVAVEALKDENSRLRRLRGENERQREELAEKDEEKREVIRQLSVAVEALKDENSRLRRLAAERDRGRLVGGNNNPKGGFLRMLFKPRPSVVALSEISSF